MSEWTTEEDGLFLLECGPGGQKNYVPIIFIGFTKPCKNIAKSLGIRLRSHDCRDAACGIINKEFQLDALQGFPSERLIVYFVGRYKKLKCWPLLEDRLSKITYQYINRYIDNNKSQGQESQIGKYLL